MNRAAGGVPRDAAGDGRIEHANVQPPVRVKVTCVTPLGEDMASVA